MANKHLFRFLDQVHSKSLIIPHWLQKSGHFSEKNLVHNPKTSITMKVSHVWRSKPAEESELEAETEERL